jgi:hypothetical protein
LSEEKVKAYFENASAISLEQAIGDHDWPDCYVYGEVVERHAAGEAQIGGFTHEWKIWPNGLGVLHYDVGPSQFLYYPMGR